MDCNGISTKIPAWKFNQQAMKKWESAFQLSWDVLHRDRIREDLESEDKQFVLDKIEQGEPSVGIQKKRWDSQRSRVRKTYLSKHLKGY